MGCRTGERGDVTVNECVCHGVMCEETEKGNDGTEGESIGTSFGCAMHD